MTWKKGQSGNPAGRAKGSHNQATLEVRALAQEHGPATIARLVKLTQHKNGSVAVAACRELLDRGYGKATQPISGDQDMPPLQISEIVIRAVDADRPSPEGG